MKRGDVYQILSWAVPVVCLLLAAGIVYYQFARLRNARVSTAETEQKLHYLTLTMQAEKTGPKRLQMPAVDATADEDAAFLTGLRALAGEKGVRILKWTRTVMAQTQEQQDAAKKEGNSVPGVTPIASSLDIAGPYANVRAMLENLLHGNRLVCIKDAKWTRNDQAPGPDTKLTCTLVRFVTPVGAAGTSPAADGIEKQGGSQ